MKKLFNQIPGKKISASPHVLRASSRHETRRGGHAEFRIIIIIIIIIYLLMIYKFI